ncbi:MAG: hypothetical protein KF764_29615 [Labilithrix sp.]|nr:hypothetical protein [Labilithrix sp.]MBX3220020.1 hypothetical protein [Labilithrix sp.]
MLRSTLSTVLVSLSLAALAGCSGGSDPDEGTSAPTSAQNTKEPSKASDSDGTEPADDEGSSLGPECKSYLACCDEIAESQPALAGSCDSTRKSVEDATKKGTATTSFESSCKQALASMQSAGYCE